MKNYLFLLTVCMIFTSCNTENDSEELNTNESIINISSKSYGTGIEYIESQHLRDQIDELGVIDMDRSQFDLKLNIQQQKVTIIDPVEEPMSPQGRIIRWWIHDPSPGLPAGLYLLDTCTGEIYNVLGRNMGVMAGVWGNNWFNDCD